VLLRRYLLTSVDRVAFSSVWIGVCSVLITHSILALPDRFCDTVDCASHPTLSHPATIRCECTAGDLTVRPCATTAGIYPVIKPTLKWEAHADGGVIKEATATLVI